MVVKAFLGSGTGTFILMSGTIGNLLRGAGERKHHERGTGEEVEGWEGGGRGRS